MGFLELLASVIDSLAWPTVVVTLLLVFRTQLRALASRLSELSVDGSRINARFHRAIADASNMATLVQAEAAAGAPDGSGDGVSTPQTRDEPEDKTISMEFPYENFVKEMHKLAEVSPAAAIAESYARLEHFLRSNLGRHDLVEDTSRPVSQLAREAETHHFLSRRSIDLLAELSRLRNVVIHDRGSVDPSVSDAVQFADIARAVAFDLAMRLSRTKHDVSHTM